MSKKWYENWFNSPYYHILYHQRNDEEAEFFLTNLLNHLQPDRSSKLLDIACGRGRHSIFLNKNGYDVTGIDLSLANIRYAKEFENDRLRFFLHDMRFLFYINYFDLALNLFTSFGYFETEKDHINALRSFRKSLKMDGLLVLDYFNTNKIVSNLTPEEVRHIDGIDFHINKKVFDGSIVKSIAFHHGKENYLFREEVRAFTQADFARMFEKSGLVIQEQFGDYSLSGFDEQTSERIIFICRKADA
ncbi:MAG TPA: class I SAM-dependent methyltransferase [Sphingobacteriaceae bacterium]